MTDPEWITFAKSFLGNTCDPYYFHVFTPCCGLEAYTSTMTALGLACSPVSYDTNEWLKPWVSEVNTDEGAVHMGSPCGDIEELDPTKLEMFETVMAAPPFERVRGTRLFTGFDKDDAAPLIVILLCIKDQACRPSAALANFMIELPTTTMH
eukprot:1194813-Pyramimonas_sp.AAC.1